MSLELDSATSIRRRLLLLLLPSLLVLMLAGVLANYRAAMLVARTAYDQRLGSAVRTLAATSKNAEGRASLTTTGMIGSIRYAIRSPEGILLAGDASVPVVTGDGNPAYADVELGNRAYRVATSREGTAASGVVISAAEPSSEREMPGHFILASTWLVGFVQVDVTLLLVWIAVHFGLRPLTAVRRQIESRSPRELAALQISGVPAEIRPLVEALNLLFDLLREATRSQRQFVADAAHQLRTPIAGLMGQLEVLMQEYDSTPLHERLVRLQEGISRLAHSANQLLALARAEPAASLGDGFEPVRLEALIGRVVELHVNRAIESGHDLGVDAQSATVAGNPRLLEDLVGNLVDNALSYTPSGSRITARCGIDAGMPFIELEDDGPGIPEKERARVRQRFYRISGSPGAGCGLGLAIVDEIARTHGCTFVIDAGPNGRGTRATVRFPRSVATAQQ